MLNSRYAAAINIVISIKSPIVIFVNNITNRILIILKRFYIRSITKATNSGYLALFKSIIANLTTKSLSKIPLNYKFEILVIRACNIIEEV